VTEQFPVLTYGDWKVQHGGEGLSKVGEPSNSNDLRSGLGRSFEHIDHPSTLAEQDGGLQTTSERVNSNAIVHDDPTDDQPPDPAPPTQGDSCAICLETLRDEDHIRCLKCGHCYHQTCIDPWLTSRRGACPLCKRSYYVPQAPQEGNPQDLSEHRLTIPSPAWQPPFIYARNPIFVSQASVSSLDHQPTERHQTSVGASGNSQSLPGRQTLSRLNFWPFKSREAGQTPSELELGGS
jgi:Ring finger domain